MKKFLIYLACFLTWRPVPGYRLLLPVSMWYQLRNFLLCLLYGKEQVVFSPPPRGAKFWAENLQKG